MKVRTTEFEGLLVVELELREDARGFFVERFNEFEFCEHGLPGHFMQDNHSRSLPRVIRGLHIQHTPPQQKLVGAVHGRILDVAVDLRKHSPTYKRHFSIELNAENGILLWIPKGFAHGFCVLGTEPADVLYKVDQLYSAAGETGIRWSDPELKIPWPIQNPILSARDEVLPTLAEVAHQIHYDPN